MLCRRPPPPRPPELGGAGTGTRPLSAASEMKEFQGGGEEMGSTGRLGGKGRSWAGDSVEGGH